MRGFIFRTLNLFRRRGKDGIGEEIEFHLDALTEENRRRGMTADTARAEAIRALGGAARTREQFHDEMTFPAVESIWRDAVYALRALRKARGFTFTALAVLALAIGLNAGLFSVLDTLCFHPLPLPDSGKLVYITGQTERNVFRRALKGTLFEGLREGGRGFVDLAAYLPDNSFQLGRSGAIPAETVAAAVVSDDYFTVLGVPAHIGSASLAKRGAVIGDRLWRIRYKSDPEIAGRAIQINARAFSVSGVMPPRFQGAGINSPQIWVALEYRAELTGAHEEPTPFVVGRLGSGTRPERAAVVLSTVASRLFERRSDHEGIRQIAVTPAVIFPLPDDMKPWLFLLMLPTGLVLVVACANLANLLLARGAARGKEIATRLALGAGRARLVRQLMTESVLLSGIGGLAGTACAWLLMRIALADLEELFQYSGLVRPEIALDANVVAFTLGLSLLAAFVCGLSPALHATRRDLASAMKNDGDSARGGRKGARFRSLMMATQLAVCTVLLVAAALMIRSFQSSLHVEPGFTTEGTVEIAFNLKAAGYSKEAAEIFRNKLRARFRSAPEIRMAAEADAPPLSDRPWVSVSAPHRSFSAPLNAVSPEFFRILDVPVLMGRSFVAGDGPVAIVSRATALRLWPGEPPVGKRLRVESDPAGQTRVVVGVVRDTHSVWLSRVDESYIYVPFDEREASESAILVRLTKDSPAARENLSLAVRGLDANLPFEMDSLHDSVEHWQMIPLAGSALSSVLGLIALSFAAVGMYGVTGFLVDRRKREFGIRIALGARRSDILRMVFRQGFRVVLAGLLTGLAGAAAASRMLMGSFYGLSPYDPPAFLVVPLFLGLATVAAMYQPASRASKVDPAVSLRDE